MREITRLLKEGLIVEVDGGYLCDDGRFIGRYIDSRGRMAGWVVENDDVAYRSFYEAYWDCNREFARKIR